MLCGYLYFHFTDGRTDAQRSCDLSKLSKRREACSRFRTGLPHTCYQPPLLAPTLLLFPALLPSPSFSPSLASINMDEFTMNERSGYSRRPALPCFAQMRFHNKDLIHAQLLRTPSSASHCQLLANVKVLRENRRHLEVGSTCLIPHRRDPAGEESL